MARKVTRLQLNLDFDFSLYAVVCNLRDFKLCFELNESMQMHMKRSPDLEVADKDMNRSLHVHYAWCSRDGQEFDIIANKGSAGYFVPEKKNIHYFLVIRNASSAWAKSYFQRLRSLAWLEGIYEINPAELRSAENFVLFD